MSDVNTEWRNLQQTGEGTWLAGQENITAGIEYDLLTDLRVYAGSLGGKTTWTQVSIT